MCRFILKNKNRRALKAYIVHTITDGEIRRISALTDAMLSLSTQSIGVSEMGVVESRLNLESIFSNDIVDRVVKNKYPPIYFSR